MLIWCHTDSKLLGDFHSMTKHEVLHVPSLFLVTGGFIMMGLSVSKCPLIHPGLHPKPDFKRPKGFPRISLQSHKSQNTDRLGETENCDLIDRSLYQVNPEPPGEGVKTISALSANNYRKSEY